MELTERQRRHIRGLAHKLKPIVMMGEAGLTDGVTRETDRALRDHELVKVRARLTDRAARATAVAELARLTKATLVQTIGHVAVLYRARSKLPRIILPDL